MATRKSNTIFEQSVPFTADDYLAALQQIEMDDTELTLLTHHYYAPEHTVCFTEMAQQMGWSSYRVVNARYGKLASRVADKLCAGMTEWPSTRLRIFGQFSFNPEDKYWHQTLWPEFVKALDRLFADED